MRQKSWNQFKKTMAASTLAGAITFTGCAVMPSVTAFADTTEQTGQVSYDNEVMPIHTDVKTEAKPLMKGTSCTVSDGKNLYYAFEMMGVRMGIMKYNTKTGKKSEVYSYKIGKNKKGSNGFSQLSVDKKYIYAPGTVTMEPMQQKNIFTGSQKTGNPQRNLRSDVIHSL